MGIESGIAWTRSTFNPWIGCTKIGPGCDACYAEAVDNRMRYGGQGKTHWGDDKPRYRTSERNWRQVRDWNQWAQTEQATGEVLKGNWHSPGYWPVFCASLADVFDNQVSDSWRTDLWMLIAETPHLSWLLVTKRIGNVARMVPRQWAHFGFPLNVRLLITVCNQAEADRDIPKLLNLDCKNGISYEPALGPVNWWRIPLPDTNEIVDLAEIHWIIIGGESRQPGHQPRAFDVNWARDTIRQCRQAEPPVPVFVKQLGSNPVNRYPSPFLDRANTNMDHWPEDLRVQEFPRVC